MTEIPAASKSSTSCQRLAFLLSDGLSYASPSTRHTCGWRCKIASTSITGTESTISCGMTSRFFIIALPFALFPSEPPGVPKEGRVLRAFEHGWMGAEEEWPVGIIAAILPAHLESVAGLEGGRQRRVFDGLR